MPLYRALRSLEIDSGCVLIPKAQSAFRALPRLPLVLPFTLGATLEHAVRDHQLHAKFETRGVSCTSCWEIAFGYAHTNRVIVRIDESSCERYGIHRYVVKDHLSPQLIEKPQDEETVLVWDTDGCFPADVVAEIIRI